jgi:Fe-S cluster assembly protein SufD
MSVDTEQLFDRQTVTQLSQSQQEPEWMLEFRLKALEAASRLSLPKLEKTNITRWNFTNFPAYQPEEAVKSAKDLPEHLQSLVSEEADDNLIIQKNSSPVVQQFDPALKEKGVIFTDLATAVREHPELVKKYFMTKALQPDEHKLAALHAALWSGGAFLYVPRNVQVEAPFQTLFWASGEKAGLLPHLLVVAEENSSLNVVANYIADENTHAVFNGALEVFVGPNARVRVAALHTLNDTTVDVSYRRAEVDKDGHMEWIIGELNDGRTVSDNTTHLRGQGGNALVKSIAVGAGEQRGNITSRVHHWGTHTESDIMARGVMKDKAQNILNGITKIEKGASKANGVQAEKVLMLSREARGDANPILLIDENDVKAGHAASVGKIDPIQMYYLMSRGLSRAEAERLIILGFVGPVLDTIPIASLRKRLYGEIERKLKP